MQLTRIYADERGESHFGKIEIPMSTQTFAPPAPPLSVSEVIDGDGAQFVSMPPGWFGDWHPAPRRQIFVVLDGEAEVVVSDGEARVFATGDAGLLEDVTGIGHTTRVLANCDFRLMFAPLRTD